MTRQKWGTSRVQFVAVLEEIGSLLEGAYSKIAIYTRLSGSGKIAMSYRRFCELVEVKFGRKYTRKRKDTAAPTSRRGTHNKQAPAVPQEKALSVKSNTTTVAFGSKAMRDDSDVI